MFTSISQMIQFLITRIIWSKFLCGRVTQRIVSLLTWSHSWKVNLFFWYFFRSQKRNWWCSIRDKKVFWWHRQRVLEIQLNAKCYVSEHYILTIIWSCRRIKKYQQKFCWAEEIRGWWKFRKRQRFFQIQNLFLHNLHKNRIEIA